MSDHPKRIQIYDLFRSWRKWLPVVLAVVLCLYLAGTVYFVLNNPYRALEEAQIARIALEENLSDLEERYEVLEEDYGDVYGNFAMLIESYDELDDLNDDLQEENRTITEEHHLLQTSYISLQEEQQDLIAEQEVLMIDFDDLTSEHQALSEEYQTLVSAYLVLEEKYSDLSSEHTWLQDRAITPPYIHIDGRRVYLAFNLSDDTFTLWEVPFEMLEYDLRRGHAARSEPENGIINRITLTNESSGEKYSVMDFRPFIDPDAFTSVIADLYHELGDDEVFIHEVWHIVTQLTAYSSEITETPRYPLETFLAGGGDCEDTAILFTSMIKAAPVDWRIELTYMDIKNPNDPSAVNHLIVFIDTGEKKYFVETTGKKDMQPYGEGVTGWYLPVD